MRKDIDFGPLLPDLPPNGQLIVAANVYATPGGYGPVGAPVTFAPELSGWAGGAAFVGSTGGVTFLSGTPDGLHSYSVPAWSEIYGEGGIRWRFSQFGDNAIAVNGGAPVTVDLLGESAAALGGSPPGADMVATVRDFVILAGKPDDILTVFWSGFNDSEEWTDGDAQAGSQRMLDGGEVMGLAGGEYGVVLQRNAIKRMTYEGAPLIFRFDEIAANTGCMAKGSVTQAGRLVFFLSERGFMLCDGNEARPIGSEKIDRTFFDTYSRDDIVRLVTAAVDPQRYTVVWAMPGTPGRLWCYNWQLDRWTTVETDVAGVFSGFTTSTSLEGIDILYPGGIDTVPGSLDDARFTGGNPVLLLATATGAIGTLAGDAMEATLTLADMALTQGRSRLRTLWPDTDATTAICTVDGRARAGDVSAYRVSGAVRENGSVPIRVNAQRLRLETAIPAGSVWTYAKGVAVELEPAGTR